MTDLENRAMPLRILSRLYSEPWAIEPGALQTITGIVSRSNDGPEALAAMLGRPLEGARRITMRADGVAILPVMGPIIPRADMLQNISGAMSLESFALDLNVALENDAVRAIMIEVDSPGGVASGLHDAAAMVRAAGDVKPVEVFASGMMASAAYWLGAAASRITVARDVLVGSIGVVGAVQVQTEADQAGRMTTEIVSSSAPNKRPDPRTADGLAQLQTHIDAMESVFIADVARYRAVSVEVVKSEFGAGGLFVGEQAVSAGMVDAVGTFEEVVARLAGAAEISAPIEPAPGLANIEGLNDMDLTTLTGEALAAGRSDLVASIGEAAATAERDRISSILALGAKSPGSENLVAAAIADPSIDAGGLALSIVNAAAGTAHAAANSLAADAAGALGPVVSSAADLEAAANVLEGDLAAGLADGVEPTASVMGEPLEDLGDGSEASADARRFRASGELQTIFGGDAAAYTAYCAGQRSRGLPIN